LLGTATKHLRTSLSLTRVTLQAQQPSEHETSLYRRTSSQFVRFSHVWVW
jgi:hypothetical protein